MNALFALLLASIAPVTYGDWYMAPTDDADFFVAFTINDSGSTFGQRCEVASGNCFWIVISKSACETKAKYPALANATSGADGLEIICDGKTSDGSFRYIFTDFSKLNTLVDSGERISFAVPMQGDEVRVMRFSLAGAKKAVDAMRTKAMEKKQTSTSDVTL